MTEVVFRPRMGAWIVGPLMTTFVLYVVFAFLVPKFPALPPYPFGYAALIGGAMVISNLVLQYRKHGVRADANGLVDINANVALRWDEIAAIKLDVEQLQFQNTKWVVRTCTLEGGGKAIRFGDLGPRMPRHGTIANIPSAGLLLAIVAAHTKATALQPDSWNEPREPSVEPVQKPKFRFTNLGGLGALAIKVGPKIAGIVVKLFKSIKFGSVAVAVGAYSLIFSWKFAVALVGMILIHECGHVFAMWRSGVPVKGIYFIPFFGGAAVSQGVAKTRAKSAYIAINGPIWGTILAFLCLALFVVADWELAVALAAWGALLNLFNLLPIFPLDGGRIVASLANASPRGVPIVIASLLGGIIVAYFANLELLALVGLIGLFELGMHLTAATYAPALALVGRDLSADEHEYFARHVSFVELGRDTPANTDARKGGFANYKAQAQQTPMTFRQGAFVLAGYMLLVGALVALLVITAGLMGPGNPLELLR